MKNIIVMMFCFALVGGLLIGGCVKQQQAPSGLQSLVSPAEKPVKLNTDVEFNFLEGPVYGPDGNIYFSDMCLETDNPIANSKIWKMDPHSMFTVFMSPATVVNGMKFDANGNLIGCQMWGHKVIQIGPDGKEAKVIVGEYNGKHIDGPNDLVIDKKGGIYFTDPRYSPKDTWVQDKEAAYYLAPDGKTLTRIIDDIEKPNGILLSPDEKTLFVNNTNGKEIYVYDVQPDGMIANKRVFTTLNVPPDKGNESLADGMVIDSQGNIYCTSYLGIQVINSKGENLGAIELPELAANVCFGGADKTELYIAGRKNLYKMKVNVPGIIFPQK